MRNDIEKSRNSLDMVMLRLDQPSYPSILVARASSMLVTLADATDRAGEQHVGNIGASYDSQHAHARQRAESVRLTLL
jgi:hypothetical protein